MALKYPSETAAAEMLAGGVQAIVKPNYHTLNVHAGRDDRLLHAVLCAYAKHHLDCPDIGWAQLGDILHDAICNEIGDEAYIKWGKLIKGQEAEDLGD